MASRDWSVRELQGEASLLHGRDVWASDAAAARGKRTLTWCRPARPALVLGSTQAAGVADAAACEAAGVEVARRRTGGGAVLVGPGECVWLDLTIGRDDPLWRDDVSRSFIWLGEAMGRALTTVLLATGPGDRSAPPVPTLPVPTPVVQTQGVVRNAWSPLVCFAGVSWGEVTVAGRKVVGLAQRRGSGGAWFQAAVLLRWDPPGLASLLAGPRPPLAELTGAAAGLDALAPTRAEASVVEAVLAALP